MTAAPNLTDQQCIVRLNAGDLDGFASLYGHHHRQVERAATLLVGSRSAHQLAGEAFGRLLILLLSQRRPDNAVRYFLYASLRESRRGRRPLVGPDSAATLLPPLPPDWRDVLLREATKHLTSGGVCDQELRCRSVQLVTEITSLTVDRSPGSVPRR
jgi:DNA-directed RNA polymerase specialized sigma24 family protein